MIRKRSGKRPFKAKSQHCRLQVGEENSAGLSPVFDCLKLLPIQALSEFWGEAKKQIPVAALGSPVVTLLKSIILHADNVSKKRVDSDVIKMKYIEI